MRGIARLIGFIFATGAIVFVVAAAILAAVVWKYEQDRRTTPSSRTTSLPSWLAFTPRTAACWLNTLANGGSICLPRPSRIWSRKPSSPPRQQLLHPLRRRPGRDYPSGHRLPTGIASGPGRFGHHRAGGEELSPELRPNLRPQDLVRSCSVCASKPPIRKRRSSSCTSTRSISAFPITAWPRPR